VGPEDAHSGQAELIEGPAMINGFFDMGRWSPAAQALITRSIERFGLLLKK
jgi:acetyl esterase